LGPTILHCDRSRSLRSPRTRRWVSAATRPRMVRGRKLSKGDIVMSKTNDTNTASKAPTHIAYHVRDREGAKAFWTRIGSAWAHGDGNGFNIQLDGLVPLDGRVTLRVPSDKKD